MRVLITGCNGLLGQKLISTLASRHFDLIGLDLAEQPLTEELPFRYDQLDLVDRRVALDFIRGAAPDAIIHTAAMTDVDGCERNKEACWKVNVEGTRNVLDAARSVKAWLVYISTDYIFDGSAGPYSENDQPNPLSAYGKSKLAAENLIRGSDAVWTILRTIVLYGHGLQLKASFLTWLLGELRAGKPVRIVDDQWGNTTLADDLAEAVNQALRLDKHGIFNVGGSEFLTRFEFAQAAADFFDLDRSLITPIKTEELRQFAPRPLKSGLKIDKALRELYITLHNVRESLQIYRDQETAMRRG